MKNATGMEETVDAYTYRMLANERPHVMTRLPLNTLTIFWNCIEPGLEGYTDNNWIDMFMNKLAFAAIAYCFCERRNG